MAYTHIPPVATPLVCFYIDFQPTNFEDASKACKALRRCRPLRRCPILLPYYVALRWCGQDCPDGEENDFRLVQCRQHYDSIPANGTVYTWQPYFPGSGGRSSYCYCSRASSYNVAKMSRLYDIIVSVYTRRPTVLTTTKHDRPTTDL